MLAPGRRGSRMHRHIPNIIRIGIAQQDCHYKGSKVLQHAPLDAFVQDPISHLVATERGSPASEIESYAFTATKKLILAIINNALWQHIFVGQLLGITDVTTSGCISDATR